MTVLDTSAVVEHLLEAGESAAAAAIRSYASPIAPDVLVVEALSALRRLALQGQIEHERGRGAVEDLGCLGIELWPSLPLRQRAWELRSRLTAGDALFVALAESLGEPLLTKDARLARGVEGHADVEVIVLGG